jgi:hypothetical protein
MIVWLATFLSNSRSEPSLGNHANCQLAQLDWVDRLEQDNVGLFFQKFGLAGIGGRQDDMRSSQAGFIGSS